MLHIVPQSQGFSAEVKEIPTHTEVTVVSGRLEESLFNAVEEAGEGAEEGLRVGQIFGDDLGFYTDPRRGDTRSGCSGKKKYEDRERARDGRSRYAQSL